METLFLYMYLNNYKNNNTNTNYNNKQFVELQKCIKF